MKKALAILLSALLLMAAVPLGAIPVMAVPLDMIPEGTVPTSAGLYNDWIYTVLDDEVMITSYFGDDANVVIPDTIEGYPVTIIGEQALHDNLTMETLVIGNNVTTIGEMAFIFCENLTTVTIPDSVVTIEEYAFWRCRSLTTIHVSDNVSYIGANILKDTAYYNDPNNWVDGALYMGNHLVYTENTPDHLKIRSGTRSIADGALMNGFFDILTIPASVTSIPEDTLDDCFVEKFIVDAENTVYSSSDGVLYDKNKTTLLRYPVGSQATTFTLPDSVTKLGKYAFYNGCWFLTAINVGSRNTAFSSKDGILFDKNKTTLIRCPAGSTLTKYTIPSSVTAIADYAFMRGNLQSVVIPGTVKTIGNRAFWNVSNLTSVTLGKGITTIGEAAFGNTPITSITIPDGVTYLGDGAFSACENLASISIPDSVTYLGDGAFSGTAYYNNSHNWEKGVLYIGNHLIAAEESLSGSYAIKSGTRTITYGAFSWCEGLTDITIPDSVIYIGDSAFWKCTSLTSVVIPDGVTSIGKDTFGCCESLTTVVIGDGVTSIGEWAFIYCFSLTDVTFGQGLTTIGEEAFGCCESLTSITLPDSVVSIADWAFADCYALKEADLGDGLVFIGECAFQMCLALERVTLSDKLAFIGNNAFTACLELGMVYYRGSESDRANIKIGCQNSDLEEAFWHYNGTVVETGTTGDCTWTLNDTHLTISGTGAMADYEVEHHQSKNPAPWGSYISSVTIEEGVTYVGERAFIYCDNLTEVNLAHSVETIGAFAFFDCDGLTSIVLPEGVAVLGDYAFSACEALTSVTLPTTLREVKHGAFSDGCAVTDVYYNASEEYSDIITWDYENDLILDATWHYTTDFVISGTIGDCTWTLRGSHLTISGEGYMPEDFSDYEEKVPWGNGMTSITIEGGIVYVGGSAFYDCDNLVEVTIEQGVAIIGSGAFYGCDRLTTVNLPASIQEIEGYAFGYCEALTTVHYGGTSAMRAMLEDDQNSWLYDAAWTYNEDYNPEDEEERVITGTTGECTWTWVGDHLIISGNGAMADYDYSVAVPWSKNIKTLTIEDGVTYIGAYAFSTFEQLTTVVIGGDVTGMGERAFANCTALTDLTIEEGVTMLGETAFNGCTSLAEVVLPNSLTTIGRWAFSSCSALTSVTIPVSVTNVMWGAFAHSSYDLEVYYGGSEEDRAKMTIDEYNTSLTIYATWHYNSIPVEPTVKPGDANGDGKVNNRDLGLFQQYLNDWEVTMDLAACDVNDDGRVNNRDLGILQQYLNEWDVTLG